MLKSSYSFYRYLMVTSEKYSHFSGIHKPSVDLKFKRPFNCHNILYKKVKRKSPHSIDKMNRLRAGTTIVVSSSSEEEPDSEASSTTKQAGCNPTKIPTNFRTWECTTCSGLDDAPNFKIISYNVLAQHLLLGHPYLYEECAPGHLDWAERSARLLNEITAMDADILCLQEVQLEHLDVFNSTFAPLGYQYVFKAKTGQGKDGCAIFYKTDVFAIKGKLSVEFHQLDFPLLNRDNVGLMVKLAHKDRPNIPLVIATTHLLYNPRRADVKLAQMKLFLAEIDRFAYYIEGNLSGHHPIILTGDFNSTPNSEVVKLLNEGSIRIGTLLKSCDWERLGITDSCQHLSVYVDRWLGRTTDFNRLQIYHSAESSTPPDPPQAEEREENLLSVLFNTSCLWQTLNLASVYDGNEDTTSAVTTFQEHWVMVDYIYYSRLSNLRLLKRLQLPSPEDSLFLRNLPNDTFGSDHFALGAVFQITSASCADAR